MYVLIWEFHVKHDRIAEFEQIYGSEGDWVRFFWKGRGFLGTELLRKDDESYLTIDRWESQQAYLKFREQYRADYEALDRKCEALTESEKQIGSFLNIPWKDISRGGR